jgi:hypothetical protein
MAPTGFDDAFSILLAANAISASLGSAVVLASHRGRGAAEPWVAFLGGGVIASAGFGWGFSLQNQGDTFGAAVVMTGSALMAPLGAFMGVHISAYWNRGPFVATGWQF